MNKSYWKKRWWSWSTRGGSAAFSVVAPAASLSGRESSRWASGFITWRFRRGQWLALLVSARPPNICVIGRSGLAGREAQRRKRLGLVTNNARFLILPHGHYPNLATRVMGLCLKRLLQDWQARYAHPVWLAESFVDTQLFRGTAYAPAAGPNWGRRKAMAAASRTTM